MTLQLRYAAHSNVGLVRKNNEDSGYASANLLAIADGMGGAAAGELASTVAILQLAEIDDAYLAEELLPKLRQALHDARSELQYRVHANPRLHGMGTTCIALLRAQDKIGMVHIGDSRAYLLRDGKLTQITHDHTYVQYLVDHGQITAEEARTHPERNKILYALDGSQTELRIDESMREARPGDRWLLSSDGLFGVVSDETIATVMATQDDLDECAEQLIGLALAAGAPDNVTVVLGEVLKTRDVHDLSVVDTQPRLVGAAAENQAGIQPMTADDILQARAQATQPSVGGASAGGDAIQQGETAVQQGTGPDADAELSGAAVELQLKDDAAASAAADARGSGGKRGTRGSGNSRGKRKNALAKVSAFLGIFAVIAAALGGGYAWSQRQYFVGPYQGNVAIYQGVPYSVGPLTLNHMSTEYDLPLSELPAFVQNRLTEPIVKSSFEEAEGVVETFKTYRITIEVEVADGDKATVTP